MVSALREAVGRLEAAGVADAQRNVEWMLEAVLTCGRAQLYAHANEPVPPAAAAAFEAMLVRRARREPVQYILGHAAFFGLRLRVTPAVLIPRPETEQVVEAALALLQGWSAPHVCDAGTGSGCIALALKHRRPDACVTACDLLAVAAENAAAHNLDVAFFRADILAADFSERVPEDLDLLISNPPYVPPGETLDPEVAAHEPPIALFTDADPLQFYRALVQVARRRVRPGGGVVFETHAAYGGDVGGLLEAAGFEAVRVLPDLAGLPRIATARRRAEP